MRFADVPQFLRGGKAFGAQAMGELILAVEAVQFGEVELGVVVLDEGVPLAAFGQPAQPAQFHPVGLGQVAMLGEETFDFLVAGALEPGGQFVVGEVRRQRVIAQRLGVTQVRALVALGQRALGFIVVLALLGEVDGVCGTRGGGGEQQAGSKL